MKSSEDIEKYVRDGKPNVKTSNQLDKLIIDGSHLRIEETLHAKSLCSKFNIFTLLMRNKIAISAMAAAVLLAVGLFVFHLQKDEDINIPKVSNVTQSPAEMLTEMSLIATYQQGGIGAMEKQMDEAIEKLGPSPNKVTAEELLEGFNGT
jgi:hypothetical protein